MSQSNAAAIRRRVNQATLASPGQGSGPGQGAGAGAGAGAGPAVQTSNGPGFTLPQVIAVIDKRLTQLEAFMKDAKSDPNSGRNVTFEVDNSQAPSSDTSNIDAVPAEAFNDMVAEFNNRFEILAVELASLKDTIIKLQTYTMDVNKMLVDERVHVFSDLGADNSTQTPTATEETEQIQEFSMNSVDLKDLVSAELSSI
jgi:hypothetical protein